MNRETTTFSDLGISPAICKAIDRMGFEEPTKIQSATIPKLLEGRDLAGQAQTGTGKTAAFAIPLLQQIDPSVSSVQGLVLCPTRELAIQITGELNKLSEDMKGVVITPIYGGQPIRRQIRQIEGGTQIVVGTPGRLIDHLKRNTLDLKNLSMVVLDEADEMLNMGFRDDIEMILSYTPQNRKQQMVLFSATWSSAIKKMMKRWFKNPEMIQVEGKGSVADGIDQYLIEVRDSMRSEAVSRILDISNSKRALLFCNTKRVCESLVKEMQSRGYASDYLHGDLNQNNRERVMSRFRNGHIELLVATDVAARGLDVDGIDLIVNYDIPQDPEYYVHRIGRTGRAGQKGTAYTFYSGRKKKNIRFIEKQLKMKLPERALPSVSDVKESQRDAVLQEIKGVMEAGGLRPFIDEIEAITGEKYTGIEVAAALLKMRESVSEEKPSKPTKRMRPRRASRPQDG